MLKVRFLKMEEGVGLNIQICLMVNYNISIAVERNFMP